MLAYFIERHRRIGRCRNIYDGINDMLHGIINVYKEAGFTSFDVVAKLRGITGQKKIGHTGTLDPAAEGVLPVCLGNATKLCELLTDKTKEYEVVLLLGRMTDTQDTTGTTISEKEVTVTKEEVLQTVENFLGEYEQIPPMYSALKVDGKRLYELAREGKTVERKGRKVAILEINILAVELPRVRMRVQCSKGTYIRTLCNDIGDKLGCGGCMEYLLRTRSGNYKLEDAFTLGQINKMQKNGQLEQVVSAIDTAFDFPKLSVSGEYYKKLINGNPLPLEAFRHNNPCFDEILKDKQSEAEVKNNASTKLNSNEIKDKKKYWVYDDNGRVMAIYAWDAAKNIMMPDKMFLLGEACENHS